ncbi:MAG: ATP-binding protein [Desulfobacterales bacterium]|jgi:two-component system sensor histidine kinase HydH|nr:ATP-binding protein [Desulfobacterales bacterium]
MARNLLTMNVMESADNHHRIWAGVPPWLFLGTVALLLPLFGFMTYKAINRQKENSAFLLLEKGAALIRAFEAGTRTGVMGTHWNSFQLQRLLMETAQQPDIVYLLVTDVRGNILAHNDPSQIGTAYKQGLDLLAIAQSDTVSGREVVFPDGQKVFEVTSQFMPTGPPVRMGPRHQQLVQRFQSLLESLHIPPSNAWVIFIGLDMRAIETATRADVRQTIIMGVVFLLIGFSGIIFLFLAQGYRSARASFSRIKVFSDNLVENMPMGLVAIDPQNHIAMINQAAGAILHLPISEAPGKPSEGFLPPSLNALITEILNENQVMDTQIECALSDGRLVPLEISATRLQDETGTPFGAVLLFKDMSEVSALRKEIARTQRLVTVGRLAAGVAHEIRNPLSSIKGFATYFKERYVNEVEDQQIAGIMIQEVDKLNRVVSQLLEFARPIEIIKKWVPIAPLILNALKLIEQKAEERKIEIRTEFSPQIHEGYIDPDRINQVMLNLFLNAAEAMPDGGKLTVTVEKIQDTPAIGISVSDTGIGIEAEDIGHIFDPYYTTKPAGTGLGLAIVHNIIEAHQGEIQVHSEVNRGTRMNIRLPLPEITVREA